MRSRSASEPRVKTGWWKTSLSPQTVCRGSGGWAGARRITRFAIPSVIRPMNPGPRYPCPRGGKANMDRVQAMPTPVPFMHRRGARGRAEEDVFASTRSAAHVLGFDLIVRRPAEGGEHPGSTPAHIWNAVSVRFSDLVDERTVRPLHFSDNP